MGYRVALRNIKEHHSAHLRLEWGWTDAFLRAFAKKRHFLLDSIHRIGVYHENEHDTHKHLAPPRSSEKT
jgi:hypothetical protein